MFLTRARRFTRLFRDSIRNGLVVRELAAWLRAEGCTSIQLLAQQVVFDDLSFVKDWLLHPSLPHFVANGAMGAAEAKAVLDDLTDRNENGHFFAAFTFYTVVGQRT